MVRSNFNPVLSAHNSLQPISERSISGAGSCSRYNRTVTSLPSVDNIELNKETWFSFTSHSFLQQSLFYTTSHSFVITSRIRLVERAPHHIALDFWYFFIMRTSVLAATAVLAISSTVFADVEHYHARAHKNYLPTHNRMRPDFAQVQNVEKRGLIGDLLGGSSTTSAAQSSSTTASKKSSKKHKSHKHKKNSKHSKSGSTSGSTSSSSSGGLLGGAVGGILGGSAGSSGSSGSSSSNNGGLVGGLLGGSNGASSSGGLVGDVTSLVGGVLGGTPTLMPSVSKPTTIPSSSVPHSKNSSIITSHSHTNASTSLASTGKPSSIVTATTNSAAVTTVANGLPLTSTNVVVVAAMPTDNANLAASSSATKVQVGVIGSIIGAMVMAFM